MKILYCMFFDYDGVHKMAEIKKYNVKDGEVLTCSLGSQNSILHVPVSHGSSVHGKNEATINDCRPGVNILPFGLCKRESLPVPCMPVILNPWLLGNKGVEINGEAVLLSSSILSCACGGIIKINYSKG